MTPGLALGIRYLTGYAVATHPGDREEAEWPPHPGRVFMALAAAHFETGAGPEERVVLEWLESLESPFVKASAADARATVTHFVPVNDEAGLSKAVLQSAPALTRDRAGRMFPRVRPHDDTVYLMWPDVMVDTAHRVALEQLCRKVVRIGHSSSFVQMWCTDLQPQDEPDLEPFDGATDVHLRVVGKGTLHYLEQQMNLERIETFARLSEAIATGRAQRQRDAKAEFKRAFAVDWKKSLGAPISRRPSLGTWQSYRQVPRGPAALPPAHAVFDPALLIFRLEPAVSRFERLDLLSTLRITDVFRRAVLQLAEEAGVNPIPQVLSGHKPDGTPSDDPHLAYVPLGFVDHAHASGHVMGVAAALPREAHWPGHRSERRMAMRVLSRVTELTLGRLGVWALTPELREASPYALQPQTWTGAPAGSRVWASVTPVVFDQHPKQKDAGAYHEAVAAMIRLACLRVGLPEPTGVRVNNVSSCAGAPTAAEFPRLRRKDGSERRQTHVTIEFPTPVIGPVLLGAGRYRGYGCCRPWSGERP